MVVDEGRRRANVDFFTLSQSEGRSLGDQIRLSVRRSLFGYPGSGKRMRRKRKTSDVAVLVVYVAVVPFFASVFIPFFIALFISLFMSQLFPSLFLCLFVDLLLCFCRPLSFCLCGYCSTLSFSAYSSIYATLYFLFMLQLFQSLFLCLFLLFAASRGNMMPRITPDISGQKCLASNFFTSRGLLLLEVRPTGTKFNQNHFIQAIFSALCNEKK
jgi:hypothetical protein